MFTFGLPNTESPVRWWGARAIYRGYSDNYFVDLLYDRQSYKGVEGESEEASEPLLAWLNQRALPWLRAEVRKRALATDKAELIELREYKYVLQANTNASYGYLYIGVAELSVVEGEPRYNGAAKKDERVLVVGDKNFVWGVEHDPPSVGTKGTVNVNSIGPGTIVGYQDEPYDGPDSGVRLLNLRVKLDSPPEWWKKQTERRDYVEWLCCNIWALKPKFERHFIESTDEPHERRHKIENIAAAPSKILNRDGMERYKEWKAKYELPPCICWDGDFVPLPNAAA